MLVTDFKENTKFFNFSITKQCFSANVSRSIPSGLDYHGGITTPPMISAITKTLAKKLVWNFFTSLMWYFWYKLYIFLCMRSPFHLTLSLLPRLQLTPGNLSYVLFWILKKKIVFFHLKGLFYNSSSLWNKSYKLHFRCKI